MRVNTGNEMIIQENGELIQEMKFVDFVNTLINNNLKNISFFYALYHCNFDAFSDKQG